MVTYNGVVTTDGAGLRGERVGGTEDLATSLDGVTAFPDHGADGAAAHVGDQPREEGLLREVGIVLLKVLLGGGGELDGGKLEAAGLEAGDDGADEATLGNCQHVAWKRMMEGTIEGEREDQRAKGRWNEGCRTWTPSGLIAMKLYTC